MALILTLPFSSISQALWLWALILFFDIVFFEVFGRIPGFWSSMEAHLHFSYVVSWDHASHLWRTKAVLSAHPV